MAIPSERTLAMIVTAWQCWKMMQNVSPNRRVADA
jgi:hypothetical protein